METDQITKEEEQALKAERLKAVEQEEFVRMRDKKYLYYEPNGVIEDYINAFASDDYFILFLSAANGVGKTAAAANMLANLMFDSTNKWFDTGIFNDFPYLKRGRIVTDSALVDKNVVSELKFWFPRGEYKTSKGGKHFESKWETKTGWEFDIMTYQQDASEFEGVTLGWAWFDEPPPDKILKATIARMRRGGIIIITATPISGSAHLYDMFAKGEVEVEVVLREGEEPVKILRSVYHVTADVESACKEHGIRGHLSHEDIARMVAEYPEDERQARVYGKFAHLIGLVFKKFDRNVHVIPPFNINDRDFVVYEYLDPHPRNPDAALWLAVDRKGTKYVIDELWYQPDDVPDLAAKIKAKATQYRLGGRWADPWIFNKDQHHGSNDRNLDEQLSDEGLTYLKAPKQRTASDKKIETALNHHIVNGHMVRPPELYIFDTCKRTIFEFEHYRWDEWKGKTGDNRNRKEKPVDKDDHMIENLGRALISDHRFFEKPASNSTGTIESSDLDPYA
jgi:phage terminase large subunit-like protein